MISNPGKDPRVTLLIKAADETVNNSTVLQNDDDFYFTALIGKSYSFIGNLWVNSPVNADLRFQIVSANATGQCVVTEVGGRTFNNLNSNIDIGTSGSAQLITVQGVLIQAVTDETVRIKWCQLVQQVADTKMLAGSSLLVYQL